MTVKLFQDVAGTIPAVLAGQPVGFSKRTKGSDDAKQATALSKPTLARWPKGGRRNLANVNTFEAIAIGRNTNYDSGGLQVSLSRDGITGTVLAKGVIDGIPYIDIQYVGTSTATSTIFFNIAATNIVPVNEGEEFTASVFAGIIGGTPLVDDTFVCFMNFGPTSTQSASVNIPNDGLFARRFRTATVAAGRNIFTSGGAYIKIFAGQTIDITVRVGGVQIERGSVASPLQIAYSVNDITEPGVPDLWHLYNDGNDSLNVILPAGTYGLASIGIDRQIVITTFVSDGTTPVNILRHERQLDVSYRLGAYSAAEEIAIRDAWGRKYA